MNDPNLAQADLEKVAFLNGIPEKEFRVNGHKGRDIARLRPMFDSLLLAVSDGNYFEMGCGTGMLCRYICLFSGKNIMPHGIDKNPAAIKLAKKANFKFQENFVHGNFFALFPGQLAEMDTILFFVFFGRGGKTYTEWLPVFLRSLSGCIKKECRIIIFSYNHDLLKDSLLEDLFGLLSDKYDCTARTKHFYVFMLK